MCTFLQSQHACLKCNFDQFLHEAHKVNLIINKHFLRTSEVKTLAYYVTRKTACIYIKQCKGKARLILHAIPQSFYDVRDA